jgi:glycosyltransferase involved in cell wall biosynthesis
MRVLIVSSFHYPGDGVSTYSSLLSSTLRDQGHETAFFAMQDDRNLPDPNSDLFVSNINFVELNSRKSLKSGLAVLLRVIYSVEARTKFRRMLERFQPDIVHLQAFHHFISPSIVFEAKKQNIPVLFTLHDFKMVCPNTSMINDRFGAICEACGDGQYFMPIIKRCKKGSLTASAVACVEAYAHRLMKVRDAVDAYVSPSLFLKNKFAQHGFPASKIAHIPNPLAESAFCNPGSSGEYLLFLGRLDPTKGIRELVKSCELAPGVKLKLAGRIAPGMAAEIPARLPGNVEYLGMKEGRELQDVVLGSIAVVVPSVWYENQPYSILEAFAAGKPVIASDLGGMTELVKHNERGLLVPPGDVPGLARAMLWICGNPQEVARMGRNAQGYARSRHGLDAFYENIMKQYNELLQSKAR